MSIPFSVDMSEVIMNKSWLVKCAFLGCVALSSLLYADEDEQTIENLCKYAYTSISRIEDGKIFLNSNKLHFYQEKIYVEDVNGGGIAIPSVFSSKRGLYVKADGFNIFNLWYCNACNTWNHNVDNPHYCWKCKKPRPR
jgi:hypothetical protein